MKDLKDKFVKVPATEYYNLLRSEDELYALESAGVDNWCGYDERKEQRTDEEILADVIRSIIVEDKCKKKCAACGGSGHYKDGLCGACNGTKYEGE